MIRRTFYFDGTWRDEEATPECGDYCDACGDCLACQDEDPCYHDDDGRHAWVVYEEAAP